MTFKNNKFDDSSIMRSFERIVIDKGIVRKASPEVDAQRALLKQSYGHAIDYFYDVNDLVNKALTLDRAAFRNLDNIWKNHFDFIQQIITSVPADDLTLEQISKLLAYTKSITSFLKRTGKQNLITEAQPYVVVITNDLNKAYAARTEILKLNRQAMMEPTKAPEAAVNPKSAGLFQNVLTLVNSLKENGYYKFASELENNWIEFKKATAEVDAGEKLIDEAHPEGSPTLEGVLGDAKVETILDTHLQMLGLINKKPSEKLASSKDVLKAVSFLKNADTESSQEDNDLYNKYASCLNNFFNFVSYLIDNYTFKLRDRQGAFTSVFSPLLQTTEALIIERKDFIAYTLAKRKFSSSNLTEIAKNLNKISNIINNGSDLSDSEKITFSKKMKSFSTEMVNISEELIKKDSIKQNLENEPAPAVGAPNVAPVAPMAIKSTTDKIKKFEADILLAKELVKGWAVAIQATEKNQDGKGGLKPAAQQAYDWCMKKHKSLDDLFAKWNNKQFVSNKQTSIESMIPALESIIAKFPEFKNMWIG